MSSDYDLRLLIYLDDEKDQGLICLVFPPATQDFPELLAADGIVCLLEVNEGRLDPPFLALPRVDLRKESRHVSGSGGALFESCLVDPSL